MTVKTLEILGKRNLIFYKAAMKLRDKGWKEFAAKTLVVLTRTAKTQAQTKAVTKEDIQKLNDMPLIWQDCSEKKGTVAFTIVSKNYMQYALVLRESYLKHNPDSDFYIILMDLFRNTQEAEIFRELVAKGVKIISASSVRNGIPFFYTESMFFKYDILEMNTAIKPFFLEYFCNKGFQNVMYIDPDIYFTGSMGKLVAKLEEHDIILTPHTMMPYPDSYSPDDLTILRAGAYNLGFIAIRNTQNSVNMCRWWEDKLFDLCKNNLPEGLFVDQKWMDLVPSMFEKVYIEKSQAYNAAYWNIHERKVYKENGIWMSNDEPLVFFHFSGMPIHNIQEISKHQTRYKLSDFPAMEGLFEEYRQTVLEHGYDVFRQVCNSYYYGYIPTTNIKIPDEIRYEYYKEILSDIANPYLASMDNMNKLLQCIYAADNGLSRFHKAIYKARVDLQDYFAKGLDDKQTRYDFIQWMQHSAKTEYKSYSHMLDAGEIKPEEITSNNGFHLVGYFDSVAGTSVSARAFTNILNSTCIPYSNTILKNPATDIDDVQNSIYHLYHTDTPMYKNMLYFINADSIHGVKQYFPHFFKDTYNIAVWWWEFDDYFHFDDAFQYVDEVIVMTDFIKTAVAKVKPDNVKLTKMTYPFIPDWQILAEKEDVRSKYNIPKDAFTFFFNFDYLSSFERKNPLGLLKAFQQFADDKPDVRLVLKTINCNTDSDNKKALDEFVQQNNLQDKIIFINETLSRNEIMTLINAMDCYISLHRSEGLGLGMMEAMYLGLPVIGTAYGGNMDFMNEENSFLVKYSMTKVQNDFGPYKAGWLWAEPDVEHASECMEQVYGNKELAKAKALNGQHTILTQYDQTKIQKDILDLFCRINGKIK